jgi:dephospho-CoA kinase
MWHTHQPIIGLMGLPGSGKSTVARAWRDAGCVVIDADALARQALETPEAREQLRAWWGDDVIDSGGHVDRRAVGRIVFQDAAERHRLESLVHPWVHRQRQRLHHQHRGDPAVRAIVEDCPLLIEAGLDEDVDVLVLVEAPWDARLERVAARGWDAAELDRREAAQAPLDTKRKRADHVVFNDRDAAHCYDQARDVLSDILNTP